MVELFRLVLEGDYREVTMGRYRGNEPKNSRRSGLGLESNETYRLGGGGASVGQKGREMWGKKKRQSKLGGMQKEILMKQIPPGAVRPRCGKEKPKKYWKKQADER